MIENLGENVIGALQGWKDDNSITNENPFIEIEQRVFLVIDDWYEDFKKQFPETRLGKMHEFTEFLKSIIKAFIKHLDYAPRIRGCYKGFIRKAYESRLDSLFDKIMQTAEDLTEYGRLMLRIEQDEDQSKIRQVQMVGPFSSN